MSKASVAYDTPHGWQLVNVPMGKTIDGQRVTADIALARTMAHGPELSICWAMSGAFGQISGLKFENPVAEKLYAIWHRWHLNGMRAGCEHQIRLWGFDAKYDDHPSEICPECGYQFGSAWLYEPLPAEVIEYLEWLKAEVVKAL